VDEEDLAQQVCLVQGLSCWEIQKLYSFSNLSPTHQGFIRCLGSARDGSAASVKHQILLFRVPKPRGKGACSQPRPMHGAQPMPLPLYLGLQPLLSDSRALQEELLAEGWQVQASTSPIFITFSIPCSTQSQN